MICCRISIHLHLLRLYPTETAFATLFGDLLVRRIHFFLPRTLHPHCLMSLILQQDPKPVEMITAKCKIRHVFHVLHQDRQILRHLRRELHQEIALSHFLRLGALLVHQQELLCHHHLLRPIFLIPNCSWNRRLRDQDWDPRFRHNNCFVFTCELRHFHSWKSYWHFLLFRIPMLLPLLHTLHHPQIMTTQTHTCHSDFQMPLFQFDHQLSISRPSN
jgi:hypothetical protein